MVKTKKKTRLFALLAVVLCAALIIGIVPSVTAARAAGDKTMDVAKTSYKEQGDDFLFTLVFNKKVGEAGEDLNELKSMVLLNQKALASIEGSSISVAPEAAAAAIALSDEEDGEEEEGEEPGGEEPDPDPEPEPEPEPEPTLSERTVLITVPKTAMTEKEADYNTLTILAGFKGSSENEVAYNLFHRYYYYSVQEVHNGFQVYRSENLDDYNEVMVTGISGPGIESFNLGLNIYFSEIIANVQYHDMQVKEESFMRSNWGVPREEEKVWNNDLISYFRKFELIGEDNPNSVDYKIHFGCESYQNLASQVPEGNRNGNALDMTPQDVVDGIELYNFIQIMEQAPDQYGTKNGLKGSGHQNMSTQIHMQENNIKIFLKGDGANLGGGGIQFNTTPDPSEKMVLRIKAGLMVPTGFVTKKDYTFKYDPKVRRWSVAGEEAGDPMVDETLDNQEGYTDTEWVREKTIEVTEGGCGGSVAASAIPAAVSLMAAAAIALVAKSKKSAKEEK